MIEVRVRVHDQSNIGCLEPECLDVASDQRRRLRQRRVEQHMTVIAGNQDRRELGRPDVVGVAEDAERLLRHVPCGALRARDGGIGDQLRVGGCYRSARDQYERKAPHR